MARLKVMVLAGGPDRERPVSLQSGQGVAEALGRAGHETMLRDILPDDLAALDAFVDWGGDVILPMLHGAWGEGGGVQDILDQRGLPYVTSQAAAARLCMDKIATKRVLQRHSLPTPDFEELPTGQSPRLGSPAVVKPPQEGSSIDLRICQDDASLATACHELHQRHPTLLVERFIPGKELTVGLIAEGPGNASWRVLPPIHIVPTTAFYDYDAKYQRDDTQYRFDIDEPPDVLDEVRQLAERAANVLGCRHLARVDLFVDHEHRPWIIEVNTIPGFTSHSLVPKAAGQAKMSMEILVDHLAWLGVVGR